MNYYLEILNNWTPHLCIYNLHLFCQTERDSDVSKVQIAVTPPVDSSHIGRDKPGVLRAPAQWRDLLTHSLSSISVESNDSNLSSGYLARKRSQDSRQSAQDGGKNVANLSSQCLSTASGVMIISCLRLPSIVNCRLLIMLYPVSLKTIIFLVIL